jgi:hypothetical protein
MNRDQRSSSRSTCPGPREGPLVPVRKQPGAFSLALLVPVATTETNGHYKPKPMVFFPPVPPHQSFVGINVRTRICVRAPVGRLASISRTYRRLSEKTKDRITSGCPACSLHRWLIDDRSHRISTDVMKVGVYLCMFSGYSDLWSMVTRTCSAGILAKSTVVASC